MFVSMLALSTSAFAAADIRVTNTPAPATTMVYDTGRWYVQVSNIGNKNASNVTLNIQLPETHTSPQVYVMGVVGAKSSTCTTSGTDINCTLGTVNKGTSKTVYFDIQLPESAAALTFVSTGTTTSTQNSTANDVDTDNATLTYDEPALTTYPTTAYIDHCTGTGLTAYYECTLFSGAISSHEHIFESGGIISFSSAYPAGYAGTWSVVDEYLYFEYTYLGLTEVTFVGRGVSSNCWEGLADFGSAYLAPYSVCF